jgi:hypothetical protein
VVICSAPIRNFEWLRRLEMSPAPTLSARIFVQISRADHDRFNPHKSIDLHLHAQAGDP